MQNRAWAWPDARRRPARAPPGVIVDRCHFGSRTPVQRLQAREPKDMIGYAGIPDGVNGRVWDYGVVRAELGGGHTDGRTPSVRSDRQFDQGAKLWRLS
jgi:hypothetical protein